MSLGGRCRGLELDLDVSEEFSQWYVRDISQRIYEDVGSYCCYIIFFLKVIWEVYIFYIVYCCFRLGG